MRSALFIACCLLAVGSMAQNPYTGKWTVCDIRSFKERDSVPPTLKSTFDSYMILKEDLTFEKVTRGATTFGRYTFTGNKLDFWERNGNGEYVRSWGIRWPKNTKDPFPMTPGIDLNYPELFLLNGKATELDVYYCKEEV